MFDDMTSAEIIAYHQRLAAKGIHYTADWTLLWLFTQVG